MIRRCLAAAVLLSVGCIAMGQEPDIEPEVRTALIKYLRFTNADLAAVRRGDVVKHGLPTRTSGEIAVAGAVRITAPKSAFFDQIHDIARFKSGPDVLQIGRFSTPPTLADLAALTVDQNDFDPRSCRVGDCGIRLPAAAIERLAREVDRGAPDAQARGAAWFKQFLLDTVIAHLSGSDHDLQYDDGPTPIRPRDELRGIVSNMPEIDVVLPADVEKEQFLYWSKEKFGLDPSSP